MTVTRPLPAADPALDERAEPAPDTAGANALSPCHETFPGALEGIVLRATSGNYIVQPNGAHDNLPKQMRCTLRGNLKKDFTYSTSGSLPRRVTKAKRPFMYDVAAVGDRVCFSPIDGENGIIEEIRPRTSKFARSSFRGREQTLVTNLDQLVIVFCLRRAEPRPVAH